MWYFLKYLKRENNYINENIKTKNAKEKQKI